jgi:isopenicillin N synthase-like dioxygenase
MLELSVVDVEHLRSGTDAQKRASVATLGRTCRETGFFYVSGHGISSAAKHALFEASRRFFALPLEVKQQVSITRSPHNRGYVGMEAERLNAQAPPDRKEAFNIGLEMAPDHPEIRAGRPLRGVNFWPDIAGWREMMLDYYERCLTVGMILHRGISLDLRLDEHYFDTKIDAPAAVLRLLHYPARLKSDRPGPNAHQPGAAEHQPGAAEHQPGAGEHTDYGNITLLSTDGVAGLEVRQLDGTWVEVADTKDLLLCNIGDCLMRWTNDEYRSTPHRVRIPETERYSIAFFLDPNPDAMVEPIAAGGDAARYPPISVRDYLLSRLNATYEHRQSGGA